MINKATIKIKIPATSEILKTVNVYSNALQFCVDTAWKHEISNAYNLQSRIYYDVKAYGLQAQLAVACIKQACGMVKKAKTKPAIKRKFVSYNPPRSFSIKHNILSISTVDGRIKLPIKIPKYFSKYADWKMTESILSIDKKGRCFFNLGVAKDISTNCLINHNDVVGVDVGINNLAVVSNGTFFKYPKERIRKFRYLRSKLQAKGTKSAKRKLKRLSGRQKRFMKDLNHVVSKKIVKMGDVFVLENLRNIRKQRKGKKFNFWLHNWSFHQLHSFVKYKAEREGKRVSFANPYLTSQTCSSCGKIGSRYFSFFFCSHCNISLDSDLNASCVLRKADVIQPIVANDDSKTLLNGLSLSSATSPRFQS